MNKIQELKEALEKKERPVDEIMAEFDPVIREIIAAYTELCNQVLAPYAQYIMGPDPETKVITLEQFKNDKASWSNLEESPVQVVDEEGKQVARMSVGGYDAYTRLNAEYDLSNELTYLLL